MDEQIRRIVLVRPGELTIKGRKTRRLFEKLLLNNIKDSLGSAKISFEIKAEPGRIYIYTDDAEKAAEQVCRVFGIKSLSTALEVEFDTLDELVKKARDIFAEHVKGKKFAVRVRRRGSHSFTSIEVAKKLGDALYPLSRGVDLKKPEAEVFVEIREKRAYYFTEVKKCCGGLPLGSEGRVVALVSGGIDSPVAAWYMMRRGARVDYVFCNLAGEAAEAAVLSVLKVLADKWSYGYRPKLYVVDFRELLYELRTKTELSLLNVLLKRYMYRAAEMIAEKTGAEGIVTGEVLGQVASQTLRNLYVSSLAVRAPIYRPLIGLDKDEIVAEAERIGTYRFSLLVKEYCGAFAEHPKTHASLDEVEREEEKISGEILRKAVQSAKVIDLRSAAMPKLTEKYEVDEIPQNAVILDLRPSSKYGRWHLKNSLNIDFMELPLLLNKLDKNKTYVLVCDEGALSLEAARLMREKGFKAYSLRGGIRRIQKKKGYFRR